MIITCITNLTCHCWVWASNKKERRKERKKVTKKEQQQQQNNNKLKDSLPLPLPPKKKERRKKRKKRKIQDKEKSKEYSDSSPTIQPVYYTFLPVISQRKKEKKKKKKKRKTKRNKEKKSNKDSDVSPTTTQPCTTHFYQQFRSMCSGKSYLLNTCHKCPFGKVVGSLHCSSVIIGSPTGAVDVNVVVMERQRLALQGISHNAIQDPNP